MSIILEVDHKGEKLHLIAEIDEATMLWLMDVANEAELHPATLVASILHDVRVDDQAMHDEGPPADETRH